MARRKPTRPIRSLAALKKLAPGEGPDAELARMLLRAIEMLAASNRLHGVDGTRFYLGFLTPSQWSCLLQGPQLPPWERSAIMS
jgi:hypothetical protein